MRSEREIRLMQRLWLRFYGEPDWSSVDGHGPDVVHGQVVAGKADRRPLRHAASLGVRGGAARALAAANNNPIESSVKID